MSSVSTLLSGIDTLEKQFDRSFVDLDTLLSDPELDDLDDVLAVAKEKMNSLSSCFSQICHKSQNVVQKNAKLEVRRSHFSRAQLELL